MNKVFFGGSRKITRLNQAVRERTDNIIAKGFTVIVGDANGADKSMQKYLAEKHYEKVVVFCTGNVCRNNIGHWHTRYIKSDREKKDFSYYAIKDKKMSEEATYGFMLWDGKSKGTLNNIINLIEQNKKVVVYFSPLKTFYSLSKFQDVDLLLANCDNKMLEQFEKQLHIKKRSNSKQQLTFV
jgi:hypothetical protein